MDALHSVSVEAADALLRHLACLSSPQTTTLVTVRLCLFPGLASHIFFLVSTTRLLDP